jgi:hypothetical protein
MTYPLAPVSVPNPTPLPLYRAVPMDVVDTLADMFDDPAYSDVVFKFPTKRGSMRGSPSYRTIYANKRILSRRSEYFRSLFGGGFAESLPFGGFASPISQYGALHNSGSKGPTLVTSSLDVDFGIDDDDSDADSDYDDDVFMDTVGLEHEDDGNESPVCIY